MKQTFLIITEKLKELAWLKMADRDRGQLDKYEGNPPVVFPCALVSIKMPRRKNLSGNLQERSVSISIRYAFERLYDGSTLNNNENNRLKALEYYDRLEQSDDLLQGFTHAYFADRWECVATIDEQRPDIDIVRFEYTTKLMK